MNLPEGLTPRKGSSQMRSTQTITPSHTEAQTHLYQAMIDIREDAPGAALEQLDLVAAYLRSLEDAR